MSDGKRVEEVTREWSYISECAFLCDFDFQNILKNIV